MSTTSMNESVGETLRRGQVITAMPLALDTARRFDEPRQRALIRYYIVWMAFRMNCCMLSRRGTRSQSGRRYFAFAERSHERTGRTAALAACMPTIRVSCPMDRRLIYALN